MLHITLDVELRLLSVRWSGQSYNAKHPRAHALCDRFDGSPLARAIAPFKHNHDPPAFCFDPFLKVTKLRLQPA